MRFLGEQNFSLEEIKSDHKNHKATAIKVFSSKLTFGGEKLKKEYEEILRKDIKGHKNDILQMLKNRPPNALENLRQICLGYYARFDNLCQYCRGFLYDHCCMCICCACCIPIIITVVVMYFILRWLYC